MATFDVGDVILGKYEVTRVLGRGGMGVVVAAHHRELDELVALKFLQPAVRDTEASAARFVREARTATRIKNEHVVRVFDVGTVDGTPFIVMEYLTGQDLAAEIRQRGPLPVQTAVDWLLQACEAIAEAHNLGFVHRDLKPANLFLTTGADGMPQVKVLDFGISKSLSDSEASVTASHAVVGSPLYMSPEQLAASKTVDARSDVWSLGIILYEMLTGVTPFTGESLATVSNAVFRGLYTRPSVARPDVPAEIDELVAAMLTRELAKRLPSVREFAARVAPFGSAAAQKSLEWIERNAARPASVRPEAADATVADGPASAVQAHESARPLAATTGAPAMGVPATTAGQGVSQSIAKAPPGASWSRRVLALSALSIVAIAAAAGIFVRLRSGAHDRSSSAVPGGSAAAAVCPVPDADKGNACRECEYQDCCDPYLACHDSAACGDYLKCVQACDKGNHGCRDACMHRYPEGHALEAPLAACIAVSCFGECTPKGPDATCVACKYSRCRKQASKCLGDPECDALYGCETSCAPRDESCKGKCRGEHSDATHEKLNDYLSCSNDQCPESCDPQRRLTAPRP